MDTLGDVLRKARGDRSLGQLSIASGLDKGYLSRIERNERKPKVETLKALATAYRVDEMTLRVAAGYEDAEGEWMGRIRGKAKILTEPRRTELLRVIDEMYEEELRERGLLGDDAQ